MHDRGGMLYFYMNALVLKFVPCKKKKIKNLASLIC